MYGITGLQEHRDAVNLSTLHSTSLIHLCILLFQSSNNLTFNQFEPVGPGNLPITDKRFTDDRDGQAKIAGQTGHCLCQLPNRPKAKQASGTNDVGCFPSARTSAGLPPSILAAPQSVPATGIIPGSCSTGGHTICRIRQLGVVLHADIRSRTLRAAAHGEVACSQYSAGSIGFTHSDFFQLAPCVKTPNLTNS